MTENQHSGDLKSSPLLAWPMSVVSFFIAPFLAIYRKRRIVWRTTLVEVRNMYAGSMLGLTWVIVGQLMMLCIYSFTFIFIYNIKPTDMSTVEYAMYVFCGLISFLPFAGSLTNGTLSFVSNRTVLLNTVFPAELIPHRAVLVASVGMPVGVLIIGVADLFLSQPSWTMLLVPVVMILQIMFVTGLVWILSLTALIMRDIQQILQYVVMMLAFVTPIAYTPAIVPKAVEAIVYFNPLSYFVITFQYLIILNRLPEPQILIPMVISSFIMFSLGYSMVQRAKGVFHDYA
jgi:lipopolysaccharide transport system permease protein